MHLPLFNPGLCLLTPNMIAGSYRILLTYLVSRMDQLNTLSKAVHSLKLNTLKVTEKSSNNLCPFTL